MAGALTARCTCNAANNISAVTDGLGNQTRYIRIEYGDIAAVTSFVALSIQILIIPEKPCKRGESWKRRYFGLQNLK